MYQQSKYSGIFLTDAIHHHHCYHSNMPRTGTVGRRDNHGNTPHYKQYQSCHPTQMCRKAETIKSQVKMQEITCPNGNCIQNIKPRTMYVADRKTSHPYILYQSFHPGKHSQVTHQPICQHQSSPYADQGNLKVGRSKQIENKSHGGPSYPEKTVQETRL